MQGWRGAGSWGCGAARPAALGSFWTLLPSPLPGGHIKSDQFHATGSGVSF